MSPYSRRGYFQARPRREVEGGVTVAKPGKVTDPVALTIVEAAAMETSDSILSRGRTYARAGQVIGVQAEPGVFTATIQGSSRTPYEVRLATVRISGSDRIDATCSCPYTCDYDWCKHAAALAYVAAFLIDTQPGTRAVWEGEEPAQDAAPLTPDDLAVLLSDPPASTLAQWHARAEQILPWPVAIPRP